jgi:hypothetical protein
LQLQLRLNSLSGKDVAVQPSTARDKAMIAAGAIAALVIVGWILVLAIAVMSAR